MKLRQLEMLLQDVRGFETPKLQYEQYLTPASLAASVIYSAQSSFEDIIDRIVADLGCGTGMLGIAASLYGAGLMICIDIDADVLEICQDNYAQVTDVVPEILQTDSLSKIFRAEFVDTVLTNPPFGTKNNEGIDVAFVTSALDLCPTVYSFHKSSTRAYFERKFSEEITVLAKMSFPIPQSYKIHKKASVNVEVDFIRFHRAK